ncbi:MAG TPA: ATP-binding protein [Mycobacteriales bacterium]|nr:ATP-binding protein [Mycobacteriales bacterium]
MCHHRALELPPRPESAARARQFVARACADWGQTQASDAAVVAVSELVTNAVLYARTDCRVTVSQVGEILEVAVADRGPGRPDPRPGRLDLLGDIDSSLRAAAADPPDDRDPGSHVGASGPITGGRGLLVVEELTDSWGVSRQDNMKSVWFTVAAQAPGDCRCGQGADAPPGELLPSGHRVVDP